MPAYVNPFMPGRSRRATAFALWLAIVTAFVAAALLIGRNQVESALVELARSELAHLDKLDADLTSAFDALAQEVTAQPCTTSFMQQVRRIAFRPDGLNEFMYAPRGMVICSTSITPSQPALPLGPADIKGTEGNPSYWINKRLDSVGLPGVRGSVALKDPFAIVIPAPPLRAGSSTWARREIVFRAPGDKVWHLAGSSGLYQAAQANAGGQNAFTVLDEVQCGRDHPYCVASEADLLDLLAGWWSELSIALGLIAIYSVWPASALHRALERYWSLDRRFRRNLNAGSVLCMYQPILDLRTGTISGVEVLARWRDVDGTMVAPDKFIDLVVKHGQTLAFTKMVADRAFKELTTTLPAGTRLQINFNIFPKDLDSEALLEIYGNFEHARERFAVALEIVESDRLDADTAGREIEALARAGIPIYIDDFGSGYSSIHRVASLAIHGVKLDRSFAMAPSESMMSRMLVHAVEFLGSCGREIVVEGVETQERLDVIRDTGLVAFAQGYLISRPLSIDRLAEFLEDRTGALAEAKRAA
jgi:sensor c-di-GMP phosphodiesterase-like protein